MYDPFSFLGKSSTVLSTHEETKQNIQLIIKIRYFVSPSIFLFMFVAGLFGFSQQSLFSENQLIVNGINLVAVLLLNLGYTILLKRLRDLRPLVLLQLLIDVVHFTLTVYKTGGITSPFAFLFFFVIFSAAIMVSGRMTYVIAGISAVLFTLIVLFEWLNILPHQDYFSPFSGLQKNYSYIVLNWVFTVFSFFAFAALASYLISLTKSQQRELKAANKVLKKKNSTMLLLYKTSKALSSFTTVREIVEYILSELLEHLNLDRALLYLNIDQSHLHLFSVKERGKDNSAERPSESSIDMPLDPEAGLAARAAVEGKAYNITHPEHSSLINKELAHQIGLNPFALAPLQLRNRNIGVIGIDRSSENGSINTEEFQVLQMFANQAAISIEGLKQIDPDFYTNS
ncbi:MAG: GAF domain-containing protein [Spirochaetales bacterium]|nr:GAF domain-containing protein [Spirochaetales bacterium]MCF7939039.1 GAF domain-containing protein [Spirochaetales bacterium]